MRRRDFISLLGGMAVGWPHNGLAQAPPKRALIGYLGSGSKGASEHLLSGFLQGMRERGYV
jgi:hypothetical protein